MRVVSSMLKRFGYTKRSGVTNPAQWLIDWFHGGQETSSGLTVTATSAMRYTPFWASVRVISQTVAALPFLVYRRTGDAKERMLDHRVYQLLHGRPNDYIDAITFLETRQAHVLTYGNGYAEIQRDGAGRPVALWPLLPNRTQRKADKDGRLYYEVRLKEGGSVILPDYNVLHVKGLGFDGYTGYNVVDYHKEAIGYGQAVKEYAARFFGHGAAPGGVLEHPENLSKEAADRLVKSWEATHKGLEQSHRIAILEEGMKWNKMGVDPEQAQALEVQKYTVDDCSRIFNIPPHKIGSLERATFSNIEELNIDFVTQTMLYWFRKWEQECNYKLFLPSERENLFCEILVDGLLRGNTKSRYEAYNVGRNAGFLSVNDIRRLENMNPIGPEGDIYLEPLNMKPAGTPSPPPREKFDARSRLAHRDMILIAFNRILTQIIKAKNRKKNGFYQDARNRAATILFDPANSYALLNGVDTQMVQERLVELLNEEINERRVLSLSDGDRLTDRLMEQIGGDNAE